MPANRPHNELGPPLGQERPSPPADLLASPASLRKPNLEYNNSGLGNGFWKTPGWEKVHLDVLQIVYIGRVLRARKGNIQEKFRLGTDTSAGLQRYLDEFRA